MDRGLDSWSLDDKDQFDSNEFYNQQKEIEVALSSAFDDISNLSDVTASDDEYQHTPNRTTNFKNKANQSNHLNASTPIRPQKASYNSKKLSDYHHNISDVLEEECYFSESDSHLKSQNDHIQLSDEEINGEIEFNNNFNKDKISSSLLMENDKLSKQLFSLKGNCLKISSNYDALQNKFHQLFKENKTNLEIIEQLQSKVALLESNLEDEKRNKENVVKKVNFLESQLESLEEELNEHRKSDFVIRANDVQEKLISSIKQKQEKNLIALRNEIENLTHQLHDKQDEINAKDAMIEKYNEKTISTSLQRMMETSKEMLKREMKDQMDKEIKLVKEKSKLDLLQSFDERMISLKEDWQKKLQGDVSKIVDWINYSSNGTKQSNDEPCPNVEFVPLMKLCSCIQRKVINCNLHEREHRIGMQIAQLKETKRQLEEALIESRMSTSNLSNNSDKSQLLDELRIELDKFKEQSQLLSHKLNKYKQHYHILEKRHQQEIESLKRQFSIYIERIKNKQKTNS